MKQSKRNLWWSVCAGLLFCSWGCSSRVSDKPVTLETLLDEMVSVEEQALYHKWLKDFFEYIVLCSYKSSLWDSCP